MNPNFDTQAFETVVRHCLEKRLFRVQEMVTHKALLNMSVEHVYDVVADNLVVQLTKWYLSREVSKDKAVVNTTTVKWLKTWWDAFKEMLQTKLPWLGYWSAHWHINYETRVIDTTLIESYNYMCPHLDVPTQDGSHLEFMTYVPKNKYEVELNYVREAMLASLRDICVTYMKLGPGGISAKIGHAVDYLKRLGIKLER